MGCAGSKGGAAKDTKKKGEEAPATEAPAAEAPAEAEAEAPVSRNFKKSSSSSKPSVGETLCRCFRSRMRNMHIDY